MALEVTISEMTEIDRESAYRVFEVTVPDTFKKEGFGALNKLMRSVIDHKKSMIDQSLDEENPDTLFLTAKIADEVIGAISFGPCSEDITKCSGGRLDSTGELGSLFILPQHQGKGVGSMLIQALLTRLLESGIEEFCLYSGFKEAQRIWLKKFGEPFITVNDYWGKSVHNMIWLCRTKDHV